MQNSIIFEGIVTKAPENISAEKSAVKFSLQYSERVTPKSGPAFDKKCTLRIDCWDKKLSEQARAIRIGDQVVVTGAIELFTFDGKDGNKVYLYKVKATSIEPSIGAQATIPAPKKAEFPVQKPQQQWNKPKSYSPPQGQMNEELPF